MKWEDLMFLRKLDDKFKGREMWFDYSPSDVFFWERVNDIVMEKMTNAKVEIE